MSRILSQTLIRESQSLIHDPPPSFRSPFFASRFISHRGQSKRPEESQLDLWPEEPEPKSESESESESASMRRLQEVIRAIVIRRAAPDWLPFVPGSSYWIPPAPARKASTMTEEEEEMSLSSVRGWPSFSYFVEGVMPNVVDGGLQKAIDNPEKASPKFDEEIGVQSTDKISGVLPNAVDNSPDKGQS